MLSAEVVCCIYLLTLLTNRGKQCGQEQSDLSPHCLQNISADNKADEILEFWPVITIMISDW